jgi:MraZ protein
MSRIVSTARAAVVGLGHKFQIWEPQPLDAHLAKATATVRILARHRGSQRTASDERARE